MRRRAWPLVVRRAEPVDREAVLTFATTTFDGWDYVPHAWPVWLEAEDGVLLVAVPGEQRDGAPALDAHGAELPVARPVAVSRVSMLSDDEAWVEGIRVDPRVRGLDVATDLQVAELHWAAAQGTRVIRYATGARNEGSHRLGARHDFTLLVEFRSWFWSATGSAESDDHEASAYEPDVRAATTARRKALLGQLAGAGVVAAPSLADELWQRIDADETFNQGHRLYEPRPWAMQELTMELFKRHVGCGEVIVDAEGGNRWAIAVLVGEQLPAEDSTMRLALLAGDGEAAAGLAHRIRQAAGELIRFRLPDGAPLISGHEARFDAAGFVMSEWQLHLLGRPMDRGLPLPEVDPATLTLADEPRPLLRAPRW